MKFGLHSILLLVAVVLFILAVFVSAENFDEFIALGLAAFAGAFLATALGFGDKTFGTPSRTDTT